MKMRITLSGANGFQSSSVCEEPSTETEEEGCQLGKDLSPKPAKLAVVTYLRTWEPLG